MKKSSPAIQKTLRQRIDFRKNNKAVQGPPPIAILQHTTTHFTKNTNTLTMSCIASSFVGSVAALKATKVQVSFDAFASRALFRRRAPGET